ncbi:MULTISPECIES: 5-deoxy-glucuronate isomerase [Pseudonocardia]|uniref:5-deoxy-glucuronate isomerase n=2 Tax=Pseudonocardia TaxID=1847 RepID=A0A1Y2MTR9_PSEAH|nr:MULTISPECIES: 5-deoxy-glucuronate isomerase [Pseudonocardia]OSY38379.1 5-deoxy-glucuronate isomerase [Pseudonocardia autotrophica]TDN72577.1 5-deoxy-glucuronate isomerase [Pseudonocardia autotrophica]BBG03285.1 5-deoxy-glucuronate isomerase [Pseudonocardia autotrophica]GEC24543.1 5-deoxy-glucuronate isomerase [Pseudonocardia saturnea]
MNDRYVVPAGTAPGDGYELVVTPESAGWQHSGLRILNLPAGGSHLVDTRDEEMLVIPLSGSATVTLGEVTHTLLGRENVFEGPSDFAYLPVRSAVTIASAAGGRFALCAARTDRELPFRYQPAAEVPVELRGAGQASRQVRNFGAAGVFEAASAICVEVITPGGNWSSYPAHKHDEAGPHECELEEIYYFEIAPGPDGQPGLGFHRTSSSPGHDIDVTVEVHDRDTVLVPWGWHGPCAAAPGHDMYYLNVMAGPGDERAWLITDHPDQAWVRDTWADQAVDSRLGGQ